MNNLSGYEYDYIVIAIASEKTGKKAEADLINEGILKDAIIRVTGREIFQ